MTATYEAPGGVAAKAEPVLRLEELTTSVSDRAETRHLIQAVTLEVKPGEKVGVVGESGSGKSITMLSIMGLLPPKVAITSGRAVFGGVELSGLQERDYRRIRGSRLAMVYQDPMSALNPVMRIGHQIAEGLRAHGAGAPRWRPPCCGCSGRWAFPTPIGSPSATPISSRAACASGS